jgi:hypothetical protein
VATLFHAPPNALRIDVGAVSLDFPAAILTGSIIALLIYGMKETAGQLHILFY